VVKKETFGNTVTSALAVWSCVYLLRKMQMPDEDLTLIIYKFIRGMQ